MFIKFRRIKFPLSICFVHTKFLSKTSEVREWKLGFTDTASKQASNVYLLTQVGIWAAIQLMWTCGLEAPE